MNLSDADFLHALTNVPLVGIDLIVREPAGRILMGLRRNRPALGSWFVPGGRICKGETIDAAFQRICSNELGAEYSIEQAVFRGVFTNIYPNNSIDDSGTETHYVILLYEIAPVSSVLLPAKQHAAWNWFAEDDPNPAIHPHVRTYIEAMRKARA